MIQTNFQQALKYMASNELASAEAILQQLDSEQANQEDVLGVLGHCLMKQKRVDEAVVVFKRMLAHHPSATGWGQLASALLSQDKIPEATNAYQKAVKLDPNYSEAWHLLGNLLMRGGQKNEALRCFSQAQQCDPFKPQFIQVQHYMQQGEFADAEQVCRNVLKAHPNHAQALFTLAKLASQVSAFEEAIDIIRFALRYSPFHISLWNELAKNLTELGFYEKAIEANQRLIQLEPSNVSHWLALAGNLTHLGQNKKSLQAYHKAQLLAPQMANIHLQIGHMHKVLGHRQECETAYRQCIKMDKINGAAYWALADLKSYAFSQTDINQMRALVTDSNTPKQQASQAAFALAKALEDQQDYQHAFEYYELGNTLRPDINFDVDMYHQKCQQIAQVFTPELLNKQAHPKHDGPTPIFIVGLPRSGSTLIEQILSSHSAIEGTMELFNLPRLVRNLNIAGGRQNLPYPEAMKIFSPQQLHNFGQMYLQQTKVYRTGKPFFIDKAPPNFHNIGLIQMLLPDAIIIDARRHPLSSGFSNFKQHYANGHDFSYNLEHIGHYFNSYLELMDHWDHVLPGKVLCVQYEDMVCDTEKQIRRLLTHCGLPFESQCLDFHLNKRAVRTSSSEQVRQPINSKGMKQWKSFEEYLTPLKQALDEPTIMRFKQWQ
jgi:tetratricopeptide (TPR) repeat protein